MCWVMVSSSLVEERLEGLAAAAGRTVAGVDQAVPQGLVGLGEDDLLGLLRRERKGEVDVARERGGCGGGGPSRCGSSLGRCAVGGDRGKHRHIRDEQPCALA